GQNTQRKLGAAKTRNSCIEDVPQNTAKPRANENKQERGHLWSFRSAWRLGAYGRQEQRRRRPRPRARVGVSSLARLSGNSIPIKDANIGTGLAGHASVKRRVCREPHEANGGRLPTDLLLMGSASAVWRALACKSLVPSRAMQSVRGMAQPSATKSSSIIRQLPAMAGRASRTASAPTADAAIGNDRQHWRKTGSPRSRHQIIAQTT